MGKTRSIASGYMIFIVLLTIFSCSGCRQLVQDEFDDGIDSPVLNCIILAGQPLEVSVSRTGSVNSGSVAVIADADVRLFINGVYEETLNYEGDGIYRADAVAQEQNTYRIEVTAPQYEQTVIGENTVPKAERILNVEHIEQAGIDNEGMVYPALKFSFTNDSGREQYYQAVIKLIVDDHIEIAKLEKIADPLILNEGLPIAVFSNRSIAGESYEMTLNYTTGSTFNKNIKLFPLVLELRTVSCDYYRFARQVYLYETGRYPDGLTSGNNNFQIYSNITNGLGIIAAYSVAATDIIYPNE